MFFYNTAKNKSVHFYSRFQSIVQSKTICILHGWTLLPTSCKRSDVLRRFERLRGKQSTFSHNTISRRCKKRSFAILHVIFNFITSSYHLYRYCIFLRAFGTSVTNPEVWIGSDSYNVLQGSTSSDGAITLSVNLTNDQCVNLNANSVTGTLSISDNVPCTELTPYICETRKPFS